MPLELRAGMVAGQFTPRAARQALWAVAHLTPQEAAGLFREVGNMSPSKSSLDRLPKACSAQWEARREDFEAQLREAMSIPENGGDGGGVAGWGDDADEGRDAQCQTRGGDGRR